MRFKQKGHALIESVMGMIVLMFAFFAVFDLFMIIWGAQMNATTCQAAARAAGRGDPGDAMVRAQAIVDRKGKSDDKALIANPQLFGPVQVSLTNMPRALRDPITGIAFNPGGPVIGTVTVVTKTVIRPFVLSFLTPDQKTFSVRSEQTFPLTYIMPSTKPSSDRR